MAYLKIPNFIINLPDHYILAYSKSRSHLHILPHFTQCHTWKPRNVLYNLRVHTCWHTQHPVVIFTFFRVLHSGIPQNPGVYYTTFAFIRIGSLKIAKRIIQSSLSYILAYSKFRSVLYNTSRSYTLAPVSYTHLDVYKRQYTTYAMRFVHTMLIYYIKKNRKLVGC